MTSDWTDHNSICYNQTWPHVPSPPVFRAENFTLLSFFFFNTFVFLSSSLAVSPSPSSSLTLPGSWSLGCVWTPSAGVPDSSCGRQYRKDIDFMNSPWLDRSRKSKTYHRGHMPPGGPLWASSPSGPKQRTLILIMLFVLLCLFVLFYALGFPRLAVWFLCHINYM